MYLNCFESGVKYLRYYGKHERARHLILILFELTARLRFRLKNRGVKIFRESMKPSGKSFVCFFHSLEPDDLSIFFRWLMVHLRCTKKVMSYFKMLQWLPVSYRHVKFTGEDLPLELSEKVGLIIF